MENYVGNENKMMNDGTVVDINTQTATSVATPVETVTETVETEPSTKPYAVHIPLDNSVYVLEFDRASIKKMEANGFSITKVEDRFYTTRDLLFEGAFYKHYPTLNTARVKQLVECIYNEYDEDSVQNLFMTLSEMLASAIPYNTGGKTKANFTVMRR